VGLAKCAIDRLIFILAVDQRMPFPGGVDHELIAPEHLFGFRRWGFLGHIIYPGLLVEGQKHHRTFIATVGTVGIHADNYNPSGTAGD
jgi:hypothetical protein